MLGMDRRIASVNLWAPAITMDMFLMSHVPAIEARMVDRACLFTLTDQAEQDDSCAGVYNQSLLSLVAHAFEQQARSWIDRRLSQGTHTAGMARLIPATMVPDQPYRLDQIATPPSRERGV